MSAKYSPVAGIPRDAKLQFQIKSQLDLRLGAKATSLLTWHPIEFYETSLMGFDVSLAHDSHHLQAYLKL